MVLSSDFDNLGYICQECELVTCYAIDIPIPSAVQKRLFLAAVVLMITFYYKLVGTLHNA
jgi:hypothetical protein